ncbi:MAG: hypothetical protein M9894_29285 [Planctomycetes bacterium]|nr:hypothetical protein [Planctomycetota bacterium]
MPLPRKKRPTSRRPRAKVLHRLTVTGSRGGRYEVVVLEGGKARCECPGFKYRMECRHVLEPEVRDLCQAYAAPRRSREEVLLLAGWLVAALRPHCAHVELVGSLRRQRYDVKDIDLVFVPGAWSVERVVALFRSFGAPVHHGEHMGAIVLPQGVGAQLWAVEDPAVWGAALLHFTGPRDYNIKLRIRANRRGWHLSQHGLVDRQTGRLLAGRTEEEVLAALDLPWLPPPLREGTRLGPGRTLSRPDPGWR